MVEKQKRKLKNSSFIARAIIENNEKFKIISNLYQEHKELYKYKEEIMLKIMGVYNLGFKNFSRRKKPIGTLNHIPYYISSKGIVRPIFKNRLTEDLIKTLLHKENSMIDLNDEIVNIGKNSSMFKQKMNKHQKEIFNGFFKDYKLLRNEPKILLQFKRPLKIYEINSGFDESYLYKEIDAMTIESNKNKINPEFDFNFFKEKKIILTIRFNRLYQISGVNEKIYIEQTFNHLRTLLHKEIANRQKEIKRLMLFYQKIRKNYSNYLMLEVIEKNE